MSFLRQTMFVVLLINGSAQAADPQLRAQVRLQPAEGAVVGGLLELQVDVLTDTWLTSPPVLPDLKLDGASVMPPAGQADHFNQTLDGHSYSGMRYRYLISPNVVGEFELPALSVRATPGQASAEMTAQTQPLHFTAAQPPGFEPGEVPLVATGLRLTQSILNSATPLQVGDTLTRELTLQADNALALALPKPALAEVEGLSRYPLTPQVSNLDDGRGHFLGGQRMDSIRYRIDTAGRHTLPAIAVKWWDSSARQIRTARLPAVTFEAAAGDAYKPVFSITEELKQLGENRGLHVSIRWLGWMLPMAVLLGLLYVIRPFLTRTCRAWQVRRQAQRLQWLQSADYAWRQIKPQLKGRPPQLSALYQWLRRSRNGLRLGTFNPHLQHILRGRYGRERATDQSIEQLLQTLSTLHSQAERERNNTASALRPLNPVHEKDLK